MSTPRFYSWDDDGSPGRALTGNLQNKLKQILVPCLVTGYGDKSGAGWTVGHEHANGFSLINADGNVVNFVSNLPAQAPYPVMGSQPIHIYAAETITDVSSAIIDGANLCSGNYRKGFPEPTNYQRHSLGYASDPLTSQLNSLNWVITADDKTFVLNCSTASSVTSAHYYSFTLYVGAVDLDSDISGNFIVLGGSIDNYGSSPALMHAYCKGYSAPINPSSGLAESSETFTQPYQNDYAIFPVEKLSIAFPRLNLQQPRLWAKDRFVGRLRGVVYDDLLRSIYGWEAHLKVLGFSGTDFTDRGKLVLIDGHSYAFARSPSGNSILTDNPSFW